MKKLLGVIALTGALILGTALPATAATPVIPNAPIVEPAYGSCQNGAWTVDPAVIILPYVENGRWLHPNASTPVSTATIDPAPAGEYTFAFTTAEGDYTIPASPGGQDDYLLVNGIAYYTVTVAGVPAQMCDIPVTATAPTQTLAPTITCSGGTRIYNSGNIKLPAITGGKWYYNGSVKSGNIPTSALITAPKTYSFEFRANPGYAVTGQSVFSITVNPPVRPVC